MDVFYCFHGAEITLRYNGSRHASTDICKAAQRQCSRDVPPNLNLKLETPLETHDALSQQTMQSLRDGLSVTKSINRQGGSGADGKGAVEFMSTAAAKTQTKSSIPQQVEVFTLQPFNIAGVEPTSDLGRAHESL